MSFLADQVGDISRRMKEIADDKARAITNANVVDGGAGAGTSNGVQVNSTTKADPAKPISNYYSY